MINKKGLERPWGFFLFPKISFALKGTHFVSEIKKKITELLHYFDQ